MNGSLTENQMKHILENNYKLFTLNSSISTPKYNGQQQQTFISEDNIFDQSNKTNNSTFGINALSDGPNGGHYSKFASNVSGNFTVPLTLAYEDTNVTEHSSTLYTLLSAFSGFIVLAFCVAGIVIYWKKRNHQSYVIEENPIELVSIRHQVNEGFEEVSLENPSYLQDNFYVILDNDSLHESIPLNELRTDESDC